MIRRDKREGCAPSFNVEQNDLALPRSILLCAELVTILAHPQSSNFLVVDLKQLCCLSLCIYLSNSRKEKEVGGMSCQDRSCTSPNKVRR